MAEYTFNVKIERPVTEVVRIIVDADDKDEALDYAYHIASEYPSTSMVADRFLVIKRTYEAVESVEFIEET